MGEKSVNKVRVRDKFFPLLTIPIFILVYIVSIFVIGKYYSENCDAGFGCILYVYVIPGYALIVTVPITFFLYIFARTNFRLFKVCLLIFLTIVGLYLIFFYITSL